MTLPWIHGQEPGVGDGDAVGVAGKVSEDLGGSGKRSLGVDDPFRLGGSAQERGKGCRRLERSELASESELVFFKSSFEASQELSLEDETENFDRQKELRSAGNPSLMIWGESSSRDYAMQMGMSEQSLAPSMHSRRNHCISTRTAHVDQHDSGPLQSSPAVLTP